VKDPSRPVVGVVAKPRPSGRLEALDQLLAHLAGKGAEAVLDPEADKLSTLRGYRVVSRSELPALVDLVVVLGGDGTLLSVARHLGDRPIPVMGVNLGSLGFLTEISLPEMVSTLDLCLEGKATVQPRMVLVATLHRDGAVIDSYRCMNDAVINKSALARIIEVRIEVGGEWLTNMRADGLIVATPTGSTAYNLSAGGPILTPGLEGLVLAPLCPHALTMRPIVLDGRQPIDITLLHGSEEVYLTADGQTGTPVKNGDRLRVERSPHLVPLVVSPHRGYFALLREKLGWGTRYP
jgi:NAD+ kinase